MNEKEDTNTPSGQATDDRLPKPVQKRPWQIPEITEADCSSTAMNFAGALSSDGLGYS